MEAVSTRLNARLRADCASPKGFHELRRDLCEAQPSCALSYTGRCGTNFDQTYNIIENWSLTESSYTFNVTPGFVVYFPRLYWRVQAIDANNVQGPSSEMWQFNLVSP